MSYLQASLQTSGAGCPVREHERWSMKNFGIMLCLFSMIMCSGAAAADDALQPMTIRLNWAPNVQFAGILLAQERGWYEDAGIDLTIKGREIGALPIEEVLTGKAQIGVVGGERLIEAVSTGSALKAIAAIFQKTPLCLMSKKAHGIETPEDLIGKRVGINSPGSELMIKIVLAHQGLRFEDITPVQIGWSLQPLIDDKVDVCTAFMNDEPLTMRARGYEVTYIPAFQYGYDFYSGVYVVSEAMLREHPALIQRFLDVTLRGWKEAFQHPDETARLIVAQYHPDGSEQQQIESLKLFRMLATLGEGKKFLGMMEVQAWATGIERLYEFQQITQSIPADEVFTLEVLENIYFQK